MSKQPKVVQSRQQPSLRALRQTSMTLDTAELDHLPAAQRKIVLTCLANLLMLAAAGATNREADDDAR